MLKLFSILALIATVYSIGVGGITKQETVPDKVLEIADWCTAQMTTLMNQKEAVFRELRVRDVTTQVVAGVNYRFTIDYLVEVNGKKMVTFILRIFSLHSN